MSDSFRELAEREENRRKMRSAMARPESNSLSRTIMGLLLLGALIFGVRHFSQSPVFHALGDLFSGDPAVPPKAAALPFASPAPAAAPPPAPTSTVGIANGGADSPLAPAPVGANAFEPQYRLITRLPSQYRGEEREFPDLQP